MGAQVEVTIDERGLSLRGVTDSLDVLFDGQHVWSFSPEDRGRRQQSGIRVAWPLPVHQRLDGWSKVTLRSTGTERVVHEQEVQFGSGAGRVSFRDPHGIPIMVDKWNFIQRPFSGRDSRVLEQMLEVTEEILDVLHSRCSLAAWVAFGSLLGAVRDGHLIGHDSDVDIAYLSSHESPTDVALEMYRVGRALREAGLTVGDRAGSFITVFFDGVDGAPGSIDVYACFYNDGQLYEHATVRAPIPREALLPLGTVELEGHTLPAPADTDALLTASYGPSWRTPDPSFRYTTPPVVKRRFWGWFGNYMRHRRPWRSFYESGEAAELTGNHSDFAAWVKERLPAGSTVVDVGAGNGRDSVFFAGKGHLVTALDVAGLAELRRRARQAGVKVRREPCNLYDQRDVLSMLALLARELPGPRQIYARFLLHALEPDGEDNFWRLASMLGAGGRTYVEFRTTHDRDTAHELSGRYRRFLDADAVVTDIRRRGGEIVERVEGRGLAPFGPEDPHVCRLVVGWPSRAHGKENQ